jgi:hypothetical protein
MFWPVHISISFPRLVVNVKCDWNVIDIILRKSAFDVCMVCSKMILSRMSLNYLQSILPIFLLQAPHHRYGSETENAGVCPAIDDNDLALQIFDRQWLRVRPVCYFFKFRGRSRWNKLHFYILQRMRRDITVRSPVIFASTTIKNVMNVVARGKKALGQQINKRMVLFTL